MSVLSRRKLLHLAACISRQLLSECRSEAQSGANSRAGDGNRERERERERRPCICMNAERIHLSLPLFHSLSFNPASNCIERWKKERERGRSSRERRLSSGREKRDSETVQRLQQLYFGRKVARECSVCDCRRHEGWREGEQTHTHTRTQHVTKAKETESIITGASGDSLSLSLSLCVIYRDS